MDNGDLARLITAPVVTPAQLHPELRARDQYLCSIATTKHGHREIIKLAPVISSQVTTILAGPEPDVGCLNAGDYLPH